MLHETLGFSPDAIEAQLGHCVPGHLGTSLQPHPAHRGTHAHDAGLGGEVGLDITIEFSGSV